MISIPFNNMAISLSGGGYRATSFHLGALSYLKARSYKETTLLDQVKIVSTISGGTLTGVMYALKLAQGQDFYACYHKLYLLLKEDRLVDLALEKLNAPKSWNNSNKTRDLINAFAEVYDDLFYDQATFQTLYSGKTSHLNDAIFGASEFTYGKQFRFQKVTDNGRFGNGYLNLPTEVAEKIRLADAAASSSCFPGGFEPMIMANDYGNGSGSDVNEKWKEKGYPTTAIMDGGVIDNQGIEGVKLAEDRNATPEQDFIGTYIVSDVSSKMMRSYVVPTFKANKGLDFVTIRNINIVALLLSVSMVAALFLTQASMLTTVFCTICLTLMSIWIAVYFFIELKVKHTILGMFGKRNSPELIQHLKVINKTPLHILYYLVELRVTSVLEMVSNVFLKRIRALQITSLFESDKWDYRVVSNNIYLSDHHEPIPPKMQAVIDHANSMPTTLWFSETEKQAGMLDDLIACGQLRVCYNLKQYIEALQKGVQKEKVWDLLGAADRNNILELYADIQSDWDKFLLDPHWLIKQYSEQSKVLG